MRVALVHDHLIQHGGAERVLSALQAIWPYAPTYTLYYDAESMRTDFGHKDIRPSFLQKMPFGKRLFRYSLPLMPSATESYDLSEFDVVISSASAFAKGVITHPHTVHICYCHTPTRYLWSDTASYVSELRVPKIVKWVLPSILSHLRLWDRAAAERVDYFLANSDTVKARIKKYYGKDSVVMHPPVDVERFQISASPKKYYLAGGRLVSYKRFDLVVDAFTKLGLPLKIFGTGPVEEDLKKRAGANVQFLGRVSDEERARLYADAVAFVNPQEEDFGMTVVESMATGRPVIAYKKGGALETVVEEVTGAFFTEQTTDALIESIKNFHADAYDPQIIRAHAEKFSTERFRKELLAFVEQAYENRNRRPGAHE
ncbi:MAG: glycosyltransferase [Patescibacteria group bacterium]|jgi:glycosyltransferase involved in cell wall biosynthesis